MPYVYFDPDYNKIPTYAAVKNNVENVTEIGELTDTITEPTLNKTLPKFEVVLYTGSSSGSTSTQTKCNGYTLTRGSASSNGDITAVSNQQIKSWVNNGLYLSGSNYTYLSKIEFRQHFTSDKPLNYDEWNLSKNYIFSNNGDNIYYKSSGVKTQITTLSGYNQSVTTDFFYVNGKKCAHTYVAFIYNTNVNLTANSSYKHYVYCTMPKLGDGYVMTSGDTPVTETGTLTVSLTHATCNLTSGDVNVGAEKTVTVTPDSGYYFASAPTFNSTAMTALSDGSYYANVTMGQENTVSGSAVQKQLVTINLNLTHCTSDYSGSYSQGDYLNLKLTADEGYIFNAFPTVNDSGIVTSFTISEDFKTAYISHKIISDSVSVTGTAILSSDITYDFYAIYAPSDLYMRNFANNHVYMIGAGTLTEYDLSPFIYNLYKLPFNLSKYIPLETVSGIEFNKYNYNVPVPYVTSENHVFEIDFGKLRIEKPYNNRYDFDCEIQIQIPFFSTLSVKASDVYGHVLSCKGIVNLYDRTMNFYIVDENGFELVGGKQQIGYNVPVVTDNFKSTGAYSDEILNNLTRVQAVSSFDFSIVHCSDCVGTVYADDVEFTGFSGSEQERQNIEELLRNGVNYES